MVDEAALRAQSLRQQHELRMAFMPWLYFSATPEIRAWAEEWQQQVHAQLAQLECVDLDPTCFIAPSAQLFAEPHRRIRVGPGAAVAAHAFLHGPLELGENVSINARVVMDGGKAGIRVGAGTRICHRGYIVRF